MYIPHKPYLELVKYEVHTRARAHTHTHTPRLELIKFEFHINRILN